VGEGGTYMLVHVFKQLLPYWKPSVTNSYMCYIDKVKPGIIMSKEFPLWYNIVIRASRHSEVLYIHC